MRRRILSVVLALFLATSAHAQTLATYQFTKGWATFGLVEPQGVVAAGKAIVVGNGATQTDVKTTWPDGSVRFAVVTTWTPGGAQTLSLGSHMAAAAVAKGWPQAAAYFIINGVRYTAALPSTPSGNAWLNGSLVQETRTVVTPIAAGVAHPLLQVVFDVRGYAGGSSRVDVTVQNVKDVTEGAPVTYDIGIVINKNLVYSRANVTHPYLTRWRKVFDVGLTEAGVVPDFTSFYIAGALPRFLSTVVDPKPVLTTAFDPLGFGGMSVDMSAPGGRPEIAPYPNWVAQYLVHERPEQRAYMLANADLAGSWRGAITEPDGVTLITLDAYPDYWLDGRAGTHPLGPQAVRVFHNGGPWPGSWSWPLDTAHMPALTYVPYLVTGDRFYLDEMKFWANFTLLATWPGNGLRQGGKGILADNQARGIAWAVRGLADLVAYAPDMDATKRYFRTRLQNNLDWLDTTIARSNGGPFNVVFPFPLYGATVTSLWANSYVAWALDHVGAQGFGPVKALRDRVVLTQVLFFNSEAAGYPRINGAPYYPVIASAAGVYLLTMQAVFDASWAADPRTQPFAGFYGPEARMMLQIGAKQGRAGAQSALDYLMPYITSDINFRSGWAVEP